MQITRTSRFTGKNHTLELNVTQAQLDSYHKGGLLLQRAFPHLSNPEREFIKSGVTAEEWIKVFGVPEQD